LEKQKIVLQTDVDARRIALEKKANSVGNIVHKSVPISDNEVVLHPAILTIGQQYGAQDMVPQWHTS
jgi:hypothetical protein